MLNLPQPRLPHMIPGLRYVRELQPLYFPEEDRIPEAEAHRVMRTSLFQLLTLALGREHSVGSGQFVYWNAADPRRRLYPDAFAKLGIPQRRFGAWKTWEEGGPPDLAVEILSPYDDEGFSGHDGLARYYECGVMELLQFDPEAVPGRRLRVWDRIHGDFLERVVEGDRTPCLTLGLHWCVAPVDGVPLGLRLLHADGSFVLSENDAHSMD